MVYILCGERNEENEEEKKATSSALELVPLKASISFLSYILCPFDEPTVQRQSNE